MDHEEHLPCGSAPMDEQLTKESIYSPLLADELRLVVLRKADCFDETLEADLLTVKSGHAPSYEALSYVWGDPALQRSILVFARGGPPRLLLVTLNLDSALRHLRRPDRNRVLWIDALCIDQHDMEEKEQQVRKMDQIYQGADNVCVWLGPGSVNSDRGMDAIQYILNTIRTAPSDVIWRNGETAPPAETRWRPSIWGMFSCLLQREWFTRRWVVQEIALAKKATVHCGYREVPWADLSDAISLYDTHKADASLARIFEAGGLGALSLSYLAENALRKDAQGNVLERRWTMGELLPRLPMFQVQNLHDVVYAVLSLASDSLPLQSVDYSQPYEVLVSKVFKAVAASSRSLDMMFQPWALAKPGHKLPSFIATAARHSALRDFRRSHQRIYHATPHPVISPVLRLPVSDQNCLPPKPRQFTNVWWPVKREWKDDECITKLVARGVICAFINGVGDVSEDSTIPKQWFMDKTPERLRDLWRVLVCGRSPDGTAAPNWYRRAFEHTFGGQQPPHYLLDMPGPKLNLNHMIQTAQSTHIADFLRRVNTCVNERRYLTSTRDRPGFTGLVPREVVPGDMICLLEGCSMPVVIRGKSMLEVAEQALWTALFSKSGRLVPPEIEYKIVSSLQDTMREWQDSAPNLRSFRSKRKASLYPFAEVFRGINAESLSDDEYIYELQPHADKAFRGEIAASIADSLSDEMQGISDGVADVLFKRALKCLFDELLANVTEELEGLAPPPAPVIPEKVPGWADGRLGEEFQAWFEQAFESIFERNWKELAEYQLNDYILACAELGSYHLSPRDIRVRDRTTALAVEAAWVSVWNSVWAASKNRAAGLGCGGRPTEVWERGLQGALEAWTRKRIGTTRAYGGQVIGECYIQGLMDGEWWNSSETKNEPYSLFIIR